MIARWMLASIAFGIAVTIAAHATEYALRAWRRPLRSPWILAMAVVVVWPIVAQIVPLFRDVNVVQSVTRATPATYSTQIVDAIAAPWLEQFDAALLIAWAVLTTLLIAQVVLAIRTLQRVQRRAACTTIDGETVLLDQQLGPAVIGLRHPRIVVPAWLLDLDAPLRSLVLKHEREHCRASDQVLVWLSVAATTLVPWNPAMWFMARRLRAAMEIDCDARTLCGVVDVQRYASLLLLIAQRHTSSRFVSPLSPPASQLSRRITSMQPINTPFRTTRSLAAASVALLAIFAACSSRIATTAAAPTIASPTSQPSDKPYFEFQVEKPATLKAGAAGPRYPQALRDAKTEGKVLVQFVVDTAGTPDMTTFKVLKTDHADFAAAVRVALADMRFEPARVGGRAVKQLVQSPFEFSLSR